MISKYLLFPYYLTLKLRHKFYDTGKYPTRQWMTPIISVGNVTVGGTGKTPAVEYILNTFPVHYNLAVLSLGYKRKSKGFVIVEKDADARMVGDEPLQIKRKFPRVTVACCKDRCEGIDRLLAMEKAPDLIILDDAFQFRGVTPSKSILLIDYNKPIFKDELLPLGHLRDLPEQIKRADAVIITKCPGWVDEEERRHLIEINRIPHDTKVFFSTVEYCQPKAVFEGIGDNRYIYARDVYVFSGIANPKPIKLHLMDDYDDIITVSYPDHHNFSKSDIKSIWHFGRKHPLYLLLTTEKDSQRLLYNKWIPQQMKVRTFCLPIQMAFIDIDQKKAFDHWLLHE